MATITVNETTQLVLSDEFVGNSIRYAEVQYGWETGNFVEVPVSASPAEVIEAYLS